MTNNLVLAGAYLNELARKGFDPEEVIDLFLQNNKPEGGEESVSGRAV